MSTRTLYYGLSLSRCEDAKRRRLAREKRTRSIGELVATAALGFFGAGLLVWIGFNPSFLQ